MTSRANNKSCSLNVMRNQNNGTLFSTETTLLSNKSLDFRLYIFTYLYYTAKLHTIIHVHFTTSFMKKKKFISVLCFTKRAHILPYHHKVNS